MVPPDVSDLYNVAEFEAAARKILPTANYERVAGGAGSNSTVRRNEAAYDQWLFRPRVLADVRERDLSTTVLGHRIEFPVVIAPLAQQAVLHPEAEMATVHAAGDAGVAMGVSMGASRPLEEIASAATIPLWFQPYASHDRAMLASMIRRAHEAGYDAICMTVDTPLNGWREADMRAPPVLPAGSGWPNMPEEYQPGVGKWLKGAGFDWHHLEWLIEESPLPVVVKGVVDPRDAARAATTGAQAVVVSNHGDASSVTRSAVSTRCPASSRPSGTTPKCSSTEGCAGERTLPRHWRWGREQSCWEGRWHGAWPSAAPPA